MKKIKPSDNRLAQFYDFIYSGCLIFDLDFLFNGLPNNNINKVAPSVITGLDINYAPNGFSTHSDGSPVQIQLTINFKETKLVDRSGQYGVSNGY